MQSARLYKSRGPLVAVQKQAIDRMLAKLKPTTKAKQNELATYAFLKDVFDQGGLRAALYVAVSEEVDSMLPAFFQNWFDLESNHRIEFIAESVKSLGFMEKLELGVELLDFAANAAEEDEDEDSGLSFRFLTMASVILPEPEDKPDGVPPIPVYAMLLCFIHEWQADVEGESSVDFAEWRLGYLTFAEVAKEVLDRLSSPKG